MTSASRDRPAHPSLIQQRIALRRERATGRIYLVLGVLGLAGSVAMIATTSSWGGWLASGAWLCFASLGVVMLAHYRKRVAAFEREHAPGAGEQ